MRSRRWCSIQSGLPESAHGSPELVKHASLVEVDGMSRNTQDICSLKRHLLRSVVTDLNRRLNAGLAFRSYPHFWCRVFAIFDRKKTLYGAFAWAQQSRSGCIP